MELVSPAGNIEKLYYAYTYGADAAYIGLKKFSLRVKADNFYEEEYKQIIDLKNTYPGKRLFCALNISFHNKDIDNFLSELDYFKSYPIDAFIIQDIGMVSIIQKYFPQATLHLSTQANCINREAVKMYRSLGFKRVVVGRETTLNEIREIKDAVPDMEIEAFGHGAMCIAYSGRCLLSAYLTGRSANGGACSHSCRWDYDLLTSMPQSGSLVLQEKKRQGEYFPVFEGDDFTAILSSKDICMIDHLEDMKKAGVDSLKIEGRMKSIHYVATVTNTYRQLIDEYYKNGYIADYNKYYDMLKKAENRLLGTGFYEHDVTINEQLYDLNLSVPTKNFIGIVLEYDRENKRCHIEQRNYFKVGDLVEVFTPTKSFTLRILDLYTEDGEAIEVARHPKQKLYFTSDIVLEPYDMLRSYEES